MRRCCIPGQQELMLQHYMPETIATRRSFKSNATIFAKVPAY